MLDPRPAERSADGFDVLALSLEGGRRPVVFPMALLVAGAVLSQHLPTALAGEERTAWLRWVLVAAAGVVAITARVRPEGGAAPAGWLLFASSSLAYLALGGATAVGLGWLVASAALGVVVLVPVLGLLPSALAGVLLLAATAWSLSGAPHATLARGWLGCTEAVAPLAVAMVFTWLFMRANRSVESRLRDEVSRRRDAEREARSAGLAREEILARIIHDLRTPMNGVIGLADVLLRTPLDPEQREHVELIAKQGDLFLVLVNDLLDFAQIAAGQVEIRERDFDPRALVEEALALTRAQAIEKGLALTCDVDAALPEVLRGDSTRLRQVLNNLIGNAVKFTSAGSVTVSVAVDHVAADGRRWVRFDVTDTGPGIPPQSVESLFRPFSRIHDSKSQGRRARGSGLGLAISRNLAELMRGSLSVTSTPGVGSTFRLIVPLGSGLGVSSSASLLLPARLAASDLASPPRVLVVDDDPVNRRVLVAQLRLFGIQFDEASSGLEAIRLSEGRRYDVVLLDYDLPDLDGIEVAQRLRALEEKEAGRVPIVAVTATAMGVDLDRWREVGLDDLLLKPFRIDDLAATLSTWLPMTRPPAEPEATTPEVREPALDRSWLEPLVASDPSNSASALAGAVAAFRESCVGSIEVIVRALEGEVSREALERAAHKLRGGAGSIGAKRLAVLAARLERRARAGDPLSAELGTELRTACAEAAAAFDSWLAELRDSGA